MMEVIIALVVFFIVYIAITFELTNKAVAALLGVLVLVVIGIVDEHHAVGMVDFETILLLLGMMGIVAVVKKTGLFTVVSVKIAEITKGSPLKILILFSLVTSVMSMFLDNVTTVLIIIPVVIELTRGMGLDPKIFVISQAIISNVAGTSTLIGDPPNIIIGSKVGLTFNQFLANLFLPVAIIFVVALFYMWLTNRESFKPINTSLTKMFSFQLLLEKIRFEFLNTKFDKVFIGKTLFCLGVVIVLFATQTVTELSPGVVALLGAMVLFVISKVEVEEMLEEVEWTTLLFFMGLFILVGALEELHVLNWIAENVFLKLGDNPYVLVTAILWVTGIASGFLDNIPFTITMIPIVQTLSESVVVPANLLWWALSLGACLGGNFTIIGASANIVSVGIAKKYKVNITFLEFMKSSAVITIISLIISTIYLTIYLWMVL